MKTKANRSLGLQGPTRQKFCRGLFCAIVLLIIVSAEIQAETRRVVVVKVDGLSQEMIDQFVHQVNPRTGKLYLPWIDLLFYKRGTRIANFYTRGLSLSAPSWSLLDTGQHLQIKGNIEFDRYTLRSHDFLNVVPFYLNQAFSRREDMPSVELLDSIGVPLLSDAFAENERYQAPQINQRGVRWVTFDQALKNQVKTRTPREFLDEWIVGIAGSDVLSEQIERDLITKLADPHVQYLDYFSLEIDHTIHRNNDRASHLTELQKLDSLLGRIWTAIQNSPLAEETALVIVSDHGATTDEKIYSQGYNLIGLLGSAAGGGHHVVTKITPKTDFSIKGLYPLSPNTTTVSSESYYLKGKDADYPTALMDFDGNERASIYLRDSSLNLLQILLQELAKKNLARPVRRAATEALFETIDQKRIAWDGKLRQLQEELGAIESKIGEEQAQIQLEQKKKAQTDQNGARDKDLQRRSAQLNDWRTEDRAFKEFAQTMTNLLALRRQSFDPSRIKVEDLIPKRAMGEPNSIYDLQNYVVGLAPGGLALSNDGSLDTDKSFVRINYFDLFSKVTVRNNVQPGIDNHPVDFVAVQVLRDSLSSILPAEEMPTEDAVWLYGGADRQALLLTRRDSNGNLSFRYLPVAKLRQNAGGNIHFEPTQWKAGLPLKIWEDEKLDVAKDQRPSWLNEWHTELDWFRSAHKTQYSNAIIGLQEFFGRHLTEKLDPSIAGLSANDLLLNRFRQRQRQLVEPDLILLANNHWNFHSRGFNPGGNHGSFFRTSTHSTLMFVGGPNSGIPQNLVVEEPYDSLSFAPTILKLIGQLPNRKPGPSLWQKGFRPFPSRVINELWISN